MTAARLAGVGIIKTFALTLTLSQR
ncbi:hypothetical protein EMIT0P265_30335 [Pseudomonas zeae]